MKVLIGNDIFTASWSCLLSLLFGATFYPVSYRFSYHLMNHCKPLTNPAKFFETGTCLLSVQQNLCSRKRKDNIINIYISHTVELFFFFWSTFILTKRHMRGERGKLKKKYWFVKIGESYRWSAVITSH